MPLSELDQQLQKGLLSAYCLIGDEALLVERAEERVREAALPKGMEVFNLAVFRGDDEKVDEALGIARTLPMMSRTRVVVIRRVELLKPSFLESIFEFLENPVDSSCLILAGQKWPAPAGGADFGKRIENRLKKLGGVFRFRSKEQDPVGFLIHHAGEAGCSLGRSDAQFLVDRVGKDLGQLKLELAKAISWMGEEGQLTAGVFEEACSLLSEAAIWDLTDAIVERNVDKALSTTHRLLEGGSAPHQLASMIAWQLRSLLQIQSALRQGANPRSVAGRMPNWKIQAAVSALQKNPLGTAEVLETLAAANEKMNSSRVGDRRVIEGLVLSLVSKGA